MSLVLTLNDEEAKVLGAVLDELQGEIDACLPGGSNRHWVDCVHLLTRLVYDRLDAAITDRESCNDSETI